MASICWRSERGKSGVTWRKRRHQNERVPGLATEASQRTGRCRVSAPTASRWRCLHVVGALAVIGEVETFALALAGRTQTDGEVDHLVEDERSDAGPDQRGQHGLTLSHELSRHVVVGDLAG